MQESPKIKWRKSDLEHLEKTIKKFNAKLSRVEKNKPDIAQYQPNKISKKEMIDKIGTRKDFNRELKSLERYLKRGSEVIKESKTGNKVSKWEYREVALKVAKINRDKTRERKKLEQLEVTSQGKKTGLKRGEMGSERMTSLEPKKFDFDKIKKGKEWDKFVESVEKQVRDSYADDKYDLWKENYIKGIENVFGNNASDIISAIRSIDSSIVINKFYSEQEASIDFIYDPLELNAKLDVLRDIWVA